GLRQSLPGGAADREGGVKPGADGGGGGGGGRTVWSSDPGWVPPCERCGEPRERCRCGEKAPAPPAGEQTARLRLEKKGRGGKTVTVIEGLRGPPDYLAGLARALKEACGSGGTVRPAGGGREGAIELQGDHRERARAALEKRGFRVKGG